MRYTRANDQSPSGTPSTDGPDLTPALGTWFNCNPTTGEISRLVLAQRDGGLVLRACGASRSGPIDWGETPAVPFVGELGSREMTGFTAHYDFEFLETQIAANLKYGILVIQSYNRFRDGSGRPDYFIREFFHQDLGGEPAAGSPGRDAAWSYRMVGDLPGANREQSDGRVDLTPLLGEWRNTYRSSKGILRLTLARGAEGYRIRAWGVGCPEDWGEVEAVPHAIHVGSGHPAGFLARYDFGFSELSLAANDNKGLLIIASFATFRDGSGRSSYLTREFYYREPGGAGLP